MERLKRDLGISHACHPLYLTAIGRVSLADVGARQGEPAFDTSNDAAY